MSIFSTGVAGDAVIDGDGVTVGICIPGIDMSIVSGETDGSTDGEAVAEGICLPDMPGMLVSIVWAGVCFGRDDARDVAGLFLPFTFIALMPPLFCVCFLLAAADLDLGLRLALLPMFIPGMFCVPCCADERAATAPRSKPAMAMAQNFERKFDLKRFTIPSRMTQGSRKLRRTAAFYSALIYLF